MLNDCAGGHASVARVAADHYNAVLRGNAAVYLLRPCSAVRVS